MGLETGNRIEDLVVTNPTVSDKRHQGDDHMRLIKECVAGSLPSLGSTAVSATAVQLNDVTNKLVSFNGRTATAALPAADDYEMSDLSDAAPTGEASGDLLRWNGTNWVNQPFDYGEGHWDSRSGNVVDQPFFTNERSETIPAAIATIDNTGGSGVGWTLTAVLPCQVSLSYSARYLATSNALDIAIAIEKNAADTTIPGDSASTALAWAGHKASAGAEEFSLVVSTSTILAAADTLSIFDDIVGGAGSRDDSGYKLTCSVIGLPE